MVIEYKPMNITKLYNKAIIIIVANIKPTITIAFIRIYMQF